MINPLVAAIITGGFVFLLLIWLEDNHPRAYVVAASTAVTVVVGFILANVALALYLR